MRQPSNASSTCPMKRRSAPCSPSGARKARRKLTPVASRSTASSSANATAKRGKRTMDDRRWTTDKESFYRLSSIAHRLIFEVLYVGAERDAFWRRGGSRRRVVGGFDARRARVRAHRVSRRDAVSRLGDAQGCARGWRGALGPRLAASAAHGG